jgi:hypothetical protein
MMPKPLVLVGACVLVTAAGQEQAFEMTLALASSVGDASVAAQAREALSR